jgi:hypothetical protein
MPERASSRKVKMWLPAAAGEGGHRNSLYIASEILHCCLCIKSSKQSKYRTTLNWPVLLRKQASKQCQAHPFPIHVCTTFRLSSKHVCITEKYRSMDLPIQTTSFNCFICHKRVCLSTAYTFSSTGEKTIFCKNTCRRSRETSTDITIYSPGSDLIDTTGGRHS